jgi:hypothetical protein
LRDHDQRCCGRSTKRSKFRGRGAIVEVPRVRPGRHDGA